MPGFIAETLHALSRESQLGRRELAPVLLGYRQRSFGGAHRAAQAGLAAAHTSHSRRQRRAPAAEVNTEALRQAAVDSISALNLIRAYRVRGHLEADLDTLGLEKRGPYPELDYKSYGFVEADLDREIFINNLFGRERATLREIVALLRAAYCGRIGVEYMHIQVPAERAWIQEKFEKQNRRALSASVKKEILQTLTAAETFDRFLDRRCTGTKRFGIEGAGSLMPVLEAIVYRGGELGIREWASAFCASVSFEGRPMCCPRFCARLRPSAMRVRIR